MPNGKIVLVANVGERDLYYNVSDASNPNFCHFEQNKDDEKQVAAYLECQLGARYIADEIIKRLEKNNDEVQHLRYPILKTVLDEVLKSPNQILEQLFLVVTDQDIQTPEQHRCRDSVNTGKVLKRLIENDYQERVKKIDLISYSNNPSNRELTYSFFGEQLPHIAPESQVQEFHAPLSGGAPALNDNLRDQALRLYKSKCRFYEVIPPAPQELRRLQRQTSASVSTTIFERPRCQHHRTITQPL